MAKKEKRFVVTHREGSSFTGNLQVIVDKKTGVNYLWNNSGYAGGLTVLVDREGKPVITPINETEE